MYGDMVEAKISYRQDIEIESGGHGQQPKWRRRKNGEKAWRWR